MNTLSTEKIEVVNLDVHFGSKKVLDQVSCSLPDKKVVALVGPSGCGKSTLLRAINRMHDMSPNAKVRGEIRVDGTNIYDPSTDVTALRKRIGMVFQRPNPFPKSVFENIAFGLRLTGRFSGTTLKSKVEKALHDAHLLDELDDLYMSAMDLSGGQQQRLCIARTIAVDPEIILMDEPCSALDPISTRKVEDLIARLRMQYLVVIVTHNMQQAKRIADLTAFMYLGKLIEFGSTEALFSSPTQELTAHYLQGSFG
jgi:phosphate transport system ATP-binding protein